MAIEHAVAVTLVIGGQNESEWDLINPSIGKKMNPHYADYMVKTFGATLEDLTFNRLPTVIQRARAAIPDDEIVGFLLCALDRPPRMTGLIFCDHRHLYPPGLPMHTPPVARRFYRNGYLVVEAITGGLYVVAHSYFDNGALGPFFQVH